MPDEKSSPKNWKNHYFWVDTSRVRGPYFRTERTSDSAPKLLVQDQETIRLLESFIVAPEEFSEYILVGAGMSTEWWRRQKMPELFVVNGGKFFRFLL